MYNVRLAEIRDMKFDVAIIGGGIIGAGVARDAALRGMSVVLFEQNDFGSGTTAGSTRLVHGGLRYLEQLDFGLVRMDLKERATLLKIAPHFVKPLPFILPYYGGNVLKRTKFELGLSLYDWFAGKANLERHRNLGPEEIARLEPQIKTTDLRGGARFFDAQVDSPEQLCLANILDAESLGAKVFNYSRVVSAIREDGKIAGLVATDESGSHPVRARITVNAAGPWFDLVAQAFAPGGTKKIRMTKGVHIACPPTLVDHAVIFDSPLDGRTMFVIPWLNLTWIGTTDTDFTGDPRDASATAADVRYLKESAASVVPALKDAEIYFSNAGVRALVHAGGDESSLSRKHRIDTYTPGLISVLGGKITGYRAIGEEVTDMIAEQLNNNAECQTADRMLPCSPELDLDQKILYAVENEHCVTLNDFVFRRTMLGFLPDQARSQIDPIADVLGRALEWTEAQRGEQLDNYRDVIERSNSFRDEYAQ